MQKRHGEISKLWEIRNGKKRGEKEDCLLRLGLFYDCFFDLICQFEKIPFHGEKGKRGVNFGVNFAQGKSQPRSGRGVSEKVTRDGS